MQQPRETITISKWLFYGSGFSLIVLALSLALTPLATSYNQGHEEQKRFVSRKIVVLTALKGEAEENRRRAEFNVESTKGATSRDTIPALLRYIVTVWSGVSGSQELLSLPADDFSAFALIYGQLEDANRRYALWEDRFTFSPFSFSSLTKDQFESWVQYRRAEVRNLRSDAELIRKNLPLVVKVADGHVKTAEIELKILSLESWPIVLLISSNLALPLVVAGYTIFAIARSIQRRMAVLRNRAKYEGFD
jgi:hypothetical protein